MRNADLEFAGDERVYGSAENWLADGLMQWSNKAQMSAHADKSGAAVTPVNEHLPRPYLKADGTLVIPMLSDPKYHWWKKGGQTVEKTVQELRAAQS